MLQKYVSKESIFLEGLVMFSSACNYCYVRELSQLKTKRLLSK